MNEFEDLCLSARKYVIAGLKRGQNQYISKAIDIYCQAITLNPEKVEPYIAIAYIANKTGDNKYALNFIKKAIEIEPFNQEAQKLLFEINK